MGFRYYRRKKILPGVSLNFSRSGVSLTVGVRGAHVTMGKRGTTTSVGIPGTGISYVTHRGPHPPAQFHPAGPASPPGTIARGARALAKGIAIAFLVAVLGIGALAAVALAIH